MPENQDWSRFTSMITNEAARRIKLDALEPTDELNEVFKNHIFGLEGPTTVRRILTRDEVYFSKIFYGFTEIESCKDRLTDIEIYIGSFPYRSEKLSRVRLLRYHIEGYFHEIYILRERLLAYYTLLGRSFRRDSRHQSMLAMTRPLFAFTRNALEGITNTRSHHVHVIRFEAQNLSRLNTLEFLTTVESMFPQLAWYYELQYREIRREWKATLRNNNKAVTVLLDHVATFLIPALFDDRTERLRYPRVRSA